jgi:hypothetical protein
MFQSKLSGYQDHPQIYSAKIMDEETMTRFLKRLNYAKTQDLAAGNSYIEYQLADIFLTAV